MVATVPHSAPALAKSNGIELCYDTFGDQGAPPMLLIMGLGLQMVAWDDDFCARLAARGYWVIRFDNRDIGLSTHFGRLGLPNIAQLTLTRLRRRPVTVPYTLRDMSDDSIGLLDALGVDSAHVVGVSMGGMIGQEMAIHYPRRVRTLTAIMSSTSEPGLPWPKLKAMAILMRPVPLQKEAYVRYHRRLWRVLRGRGYPEDEARDRARAETAFARGLNPAGAIRQIAAIIAAGGRREALRQVAVPTLVIHGEADPLIPVRGGIDIARSVPGAKQLIIKGMGHALPMSEWDRIIEAIAQHAVEHKARETA